MKAVIMAGGKGTRVVSVRSDVPKSMLDVADKPILMHQIECLRRQGIYEIVLVIGYLGNVIRDSFGDGSHLGVKLTYIVEDKPLGTAGALFLLKDVLKQDFLLLNGDLIFDVDLARFKAAHQEKQALATIFTHPNSHPYDSSIVVADENGRVTDWLHKEDLRLWYKNRVNAGLHMISPQIFERLDSLHKRDLDRDILKPLIDTCKLYCYDSSEYVKDVGTPKRLLQAEEDLKSGLVSAKNLTKKQKAVFLDRDGTINKYVGFLRDINQFELLPDVAEAIQTINQQGYLTIVVSNQPVIARGEVSWEDLWEIHNKMETLLGWEGAYVDDIFVCPHHPDKGFAGERVEYKIDCECRKPRPGMILDAAKKYNIDLSQSVMVGDSKADADAGKNAGCGKFVGSVQGVLKALDEGRGCM